MSYGQDDDLDFDEAPLTRERRHALIDRHPLQDPALVQAFLAQGEAWMTAGGQYVAVAEMTPGHALATANFVLDRARAAALTLLAVEDERVSEPIVCDDQASRLVLIDTALVQALLERGRAARPSSLPWASVAAAAR